MTLDLDMSLLPATDGNGHGEMAPEVELSDGPAVYTKENLLPPPVAG
jgi:hypothetical protein